MSRDLGLARMILYGRESRQMSEGPSSLCVDSGFDSVEPDCALIRIWNRVRWSNLPVSNPLSDSYLVDPASSHMLVSKIKPCMSKYKPH